MKLTQSGIFIANRTFYFTLHEISLQCIKYTFLCLYNPVNFCTEAETAIFEDAAM